MENKEQKYVYIVLESSVYEGEDEHRVEVYENLKDASTRYDRIVDCYMRDDSDFTEAYKDGRVYKATGYEDAPDDADYVLDSHYDETEEEYIGFWGFYKNGYYSVDHVEVRLMKKPIK